MIGNFSEILSPEEILKKLADLTKPFPDVREIRLLCQKGAQNSIVCVIDANQHSWAVADAIGGFLFGGRPARNIVPLAAEFRCAGRPDGKLISGFCAKCAVTIDGAVGAAEDSQEKR